MSYCMCSPNYSRGFARVRSTGILQRARGFSGLLGRSKYPATEFTGDVIQLSA